MKTSCKKFQCFLATLLHSAKFMQHCIKSIHLKWEKHFAQIVIYELFKIHNVKVGTLNKATMSWSRVIHLFILFLYFINIILIPCHDYAIYYVCI